MIKSLEINERLEKYISDHSYDLHPIQKEILSHNDGLGLSKRMQISVTQAYFFQLFPNPLLTPDQLCLLKYPNIKSESGTTNFDIGCPSKLYFEESVKKYSFNWRDGGQFSIIENNKK